jgi:cysteine desulfurase
MEPYWSEWFYNPSSLYTVARQSRQALEAARGEVADVLGARKTEIIFTAGGTESVNLAILGVARRNPGSQVLASAIEHAAVRAGLTRLEVEGHTTRLIPVSREGLIDLPALQAAINDRTVLVSVMLASNEVGTIQPLAKMAQIIKQVRADRQKRGVGMPLYLHTDAAQAANYLDLQVSRLGVDLMSLNGGKIYGPKQSGCLYVRTGTELEPLIYGGGQERNLRSGTENLPGAVGFATALRLVQTDRQAESVRLEALRHQALKDLLSMAGVKLNGDAKRRLPNNINLTIDDLSGETLVHYLDQAGIAASTGSACSTGSLDPSPALIALGLTPEQTQSSLRLTLGRGTTAADIKHLLQVFPRIVTRLRSLDGS